MGCKRRVKDSIVKWADVNSFVDFGSKLSLINEGRQVTTGQSGPSEGQHFWLQGSVYCVWSWYSLVAIAALEEYWKSNLAVVWDFS
jgi:hypothetical protein